MTKRSRVGEWFFVLLLSAILVWFVGPVCVESEPPDSPEIAKAVAFGDRFIRLLADKKWDEAYGLTSAEYRRLMSPS